ncbi:FecR domain-containing protein [Neorhizobium sp. T786]|nr:FecR domain-containing protein [Neorhizobium xiangyangii]
MLKILRPIIAIITLGFVFASGAHAQEWLVQRATKQVQFTIDKQNWHAVVQGQTIPNKAWISTGPRGRAVLSRGQERIQIQPGTLAAIITSGYLTRKTEIVQQAGKLVLEIEKRARPHTYVHTPFLAAVVKGTTFEVAVTAKQATVSVEEGLVEVTSFTGGQRTNVGAGQRATVNGAQRMSVAGAVATPSVVSVSPRAASVPVLGQQTPIGREPDDTVQGPQGATANSESPASSGTTQSSQRSEGNGGGNGSGNGNGGGNGNGNGGGNGNGNGNNGNGGGGGGNGNGNGNGNGGGNGNGNNGNGGGNSNGNGGGNGNGNNGNNGNGGANGNGNGNNGNGNGNGGANGNGNGNGR